MIRHYNGWKVHKNPNAPITGRWSAVWHGVSMCHNTHEGLIRMIDIRTHESRESWRRRAQ